MLLANGAGVAHRVSGADARRTDQLGGKVGLLATVKTKPPQVRAELIGSDTCTALGITSRSSTPVLEICRWLINAGCDPATPLRVYRSDTLALWVHSLDAGAALTVKSAGNGSPIFVSAKGAGASPIAPNRRGPP
jgi:hypothetical protein